MKPSPNLISATAILVILFACFTQIGATAWIGNVNPTLAKSSRYESSYVVERFNSTHYQATNGTSGAVESLSTNARQVINNALGNLTLSRTWTETVLLKGTFTVSGSINIVSSFTCLTGGEGLATIVLADNSNCDVIYVTPTVRMVTLSNLIINGNKGATGTLQTKGNCVNATFASGGAISTPYEGLRLSNVKMLEAKTDCLRMVGSTSARLFMDNCETRETGSGGGNTIYLYNVADSFISDCTFQQSYFRGLEACHITGCYFGGGVTTLYSSCRYNEFSGCRFDYSGTMVLYLTGSLGYTPHHNTFSGCHFLRASRTTNNTSSYIYAEYDTSSNKFSGCQFNQETEVNKVKYCFEEKAGSTCDYNTLEGCDLAGYGTAPVNFVGVHSVWIQTDWYAQGEQYSYMVYKLGSNYYAKNGSSGLVEFGPSTNASYVIESAWNNVNEGSVYIKSGNYSCPTFLTVPDYVSLKIIGDGMNMTVLEYTGTATDAFLVVGAVNYTHLEGITFDANGLATHVCNWTGANVGAGVSTNKPYQQTIQQCHFTRATSYALALYRRFEDCNDNILVLNNRITLSYGGIYLASGDNTIHGNAVSRCYNSTGDSEAAGLWSVVSGTNRITGNYFGGSCEYGMYINTHRNIISGNIIDHQYLHGVKFQYCQGNVFVGNKVSDIGINNDNTWSGIYLAGNSANNTISSNEVYQGDIANHGYMKYGINLASSTCVGNVITGNNIMGFATQGVFIHASATGNVFSSCVIETKATEVYGQLNNVANNTWIAHNLPDFSTRSSFFIQLGCSYSYNATITTLVKTVNVYVCGFNSTKVLLVGNNATYSGTYFGKYYP